MKLIKTFSSVVAATIVAFVLFNLFSAGVLALRDSIKGKQFSATNLDNLVDLHPGLTRQDIQQLTSETWGIHLSYDSWASFRESARNGRFVNVDAAGFRHIPGQRPLSYKGPKVFFFGGSTAFGYGVQDADTIPAYLAKFIGRDDVAVYNFGQGYYFSRQELAIFSQLLIEGNKPDIAIFFDGVNERCETYVLQAEVAQIFASAASGEYSLSSWKALPMVRLADRVANKLTGSNSRTDGAGVSVNRFYGCGKPEIARRYASAVKTIQALCGVYGVKCFHFLQPSNGFPLVNERFGTYDQKELLVQLQTAGKPLGVIDLIQPFETYRKHAFVDRAHYTPEVNRLLAEKIYLYTTSVYR